MRRNLLCIYNFLIKIYITHIHIHIHSVCVLKGAMNIFKSIVKWSEKHCIACKMVDRECLWIMAPIWNISQPSYHQESQIHSNFDGPLKTMTVTQYFIIFYGYFFFLLMFFFSQFWFYFFVSPFNGVVSMVCLLLLSPSLRSQNWQSSSSAVVLHELFDNSTKKNSQCENKN